LNRTTSTQVSMTRYWVSAPKMTVTVTVDENNIIKGTAPITQKFVGQKLDNLLDWMKKQGKVTMMEI